MVIGNLTIADESQAQQYDTNNVWSSNFDDLSTVGAGNVLLRGHKFAELKSKTNFSSVRLFGKKTWHGRRVDVKLSGDVIDYFTGKTSSFSGYCNNNYAFLERDTSRFQNGGYTCTSYGFHAVHHNIRLYGGVFFVANTIYIHALGTQLMCDDTDNYDISFNNIGTWIYYIR